MHDEALSWLRHIAHLIGPCRAVCEMGSRLVNGSAGDLFGPSDVSIGIDLRPGPGVDIVADAADWDDGRRFSAVVCTEMLEHTPRGPEVCGNAHRLLVPGGVFVVTCAGPGRQPHSGVDGMELRRGEHYANIKPENLAAWLAPFPVRLVQVRGDDVYALAVKEVVNVP